jgi:hypothetical protein
MNRAKVVGQTIDDGDLVLVLVRQQKKARRKLSSPPRMESDDQKLAKGPGCYVLKPESTKQKDRPVSLAKLPGPTHRVQSILKRRKDRAR